MAIRVLVATRNWQDAGAISAALHSAGGDVEVVGNPRSYQEVLDDGPNLGANVVLPVTGDFGLPTGVGCRAPAARSAQ